MTKTLRRAVRWTVTPVTLVVLWLFVRMLSVFIVGLLGGDHATFELHMAKTLLWFPLGIAGIAGVGWWLAGKLHWQVVRTVCHEVFSVYLAVFLGVSMVFVHARYHWSVYLPIGLLIALVILIDPDDERFWSRAIRFSAIPIVTLLTIHYAATVR